MPGGARFLCSALALSVGLLPSASLAWQRTFDGSAVEDTLYATGDAGRHVAVDGAGDVIVGGELVRVGTGKDIAVLKLAGDTGTQRWLYAVDGSGTPEKDELELDEPNAIAVDGAGDVLVAGSLENAGSKSDFVVLKLAGTTGAELWRHEIDSLPGTPECCANDRALAVAVDAAGDVIAAGHVASEDSPAHLIVVKLAGATGAERWRTVLYEPRVGPEGLATSVAVDAAGDVVAAGHLDGDFAVVKLSGSTGAEIWRSTTSGPLGSSMYDFATALALDGAGAAIAGGFLGGAEEDFFVIKLAAATGVEEWRHQVAGSSPGDNPDFANAVAVDAAGNAIAVGELANDSTRDDFVAMKLDGADGTELWRRELVGGGAGSVVIAADGDAIVGGTFMIAPNEWRQAVVRLGGTSGDERWRHDVPLPGIGSSVAVDPAGDVITTGTTMVVPFSPRRPRREPNDMLVTKLHGSDGTRFVSGPTPCPPSPAVACRGGPGHGAFVVNERTPGAEWLSLRWRGRTGPAPTDFGNPLFEDGTAYSVCVYDDAARLQAEYRIDRAGMTCGARPCWAKLDRWRRVPEATGYRFTDQADAIRFVELLSSPDGDLVVAVKGRNRLSSSLRPGVAAALQPSIRGITMQLLSGPGSDQCVSVALPRVVNATGAVYRAATTR